MNLLLLGEEGAGVLDLPVARRHWRRVLLAAGLTVGVVALCGPVGFVGGGGAPRPGPVGDHGVLQMGCYYLLVYAVLGGVLLLACDLLTRLLYPPAGLSVGLVTALFGVPFFVYLSRKNN